MLPEVHVFIAMSLDGYIADVAGGLDWLVMLPAPDDEDHGYAAFYDRVDCLLIGANTFRSLLGYRDWPYDKPVTVLSASLSQRDVPPALRNRVTILDDTPEAALSQLAQGGAKRVYLDGGQLISSCLRDGLVQRMTLTRLPVLLGAGVPLFTDPGPQYMIHLDTRSWPHGFVQSIYQVIP